MEGLLVLLLIVWAFAQAGRKPKKTIGKTASGAQKESSTQNENDRRKRLQAELEKRKAQIAQEKNTEPVAAMPERQMTAEYRKLEPHFRGSMQSDSTEGECICDPELEHARETAPESVYAGEIGKESLVDFSARGVMQGVVMSEILTRPAQRTRRR